MEMKKNRMLYIMLLPAVLLVLLLNYLPMAGIILAFKNFRYNLGIWGSEWAGLRNFRFFFLSGTGWMVTRNTILYNLINLLTTQLLAIIIAIVLNDIRGRLFKKLSQSAIFLPYFISWIIVGVFAYNIFNYESGLLNGALKALGAKPVNVYAEPSLWWLIIPSFNAWKWVGYTSVIYIAAITGIDPECYESADIDGANIFQKTFYITLPSIRTTIIIMLLLSIGRILRGDFQMFYQLVGNNGQLFSATDVIDTFVFRSLVTGGDLSMSSAATFYQSVLCFLIIVLVNGVVRRVDPDSALF
ncbi:MAG: sugar ABC transporter permease [Clostridiales bacterium]|nr:sugar ABC transporter permease [Clostridiales bacterium]